MAMRNMINEPAIAKEETSIPKMPSKGLPINKNASKIKKETRVTLKDFITPDFALMSMSMGIDPGISIIAKSTMKAASISIGLKCMVRVFSY
jgi:hypothetical protein